MKGEEQPTALTAVDVVVSVLSFKLLAQWLYLGQVIGKLTPEEEEGITATIE